MHRKANTTIIGRMTPWERQMGRFLRSPDGHPEGGAEAPAAAAETPAAADAAAGAETPAPDDAASGGAGADAVGDASPGDAADGAEGAADEGEGTSGDAPAAEAAPFEGLTPPEGFAALDAEALAAATPLLRSLGVETTEQAQDAVNQFGPIISSIVERAVTSAADTAKANQADLVKSWADEVRADPAIGGGNYDRTVANNAVVLDTFFSEGFRKYLDVTGLGNHPEMVKGLANIHKQVETGAIHLGAATPQQRAPHQKLYDPVYDGPQAT